MSDDKAVKVSPVTILSHYIYIYLKNDPGVTNNNAAYLVGC